MNSGKIHTPGERRRGTTKQRAVPDGERCRRKSDRSDGGMPASAIAGAGSLAVLLGKSIPEIATPPVGRLKALAGQEPRPAWPVPGPAEPGGGECPGQRTPRAGDAHTRAEGSYTGGTGTPTAC
jgi:hypothetical protein